MSDHAATVREAEALISAPFSPDTRWEAEARVVIVGLLAALDALVAERDEAQREMEREGTRANDEAMAGRAWQIRAEAAEAERDRLSETARAVVDAYHRESEDANDGEFALWKADDLINAIIALRAALSVSGRGAA